jgi:hypothetical protein
MLFSKFRFAAKGYLAKREADPAAVVCLGDSAYHRLSMKEKQKVKYLHDSVSPTDILGW